MIDIWGLVIRDDEEEPGPTQAELIEQDQQQLEIVRGARAEIQKRKIKRLADAMEAETGRKPIVRSLADELALPDDELPYSIDKLLTLGGNALFAGQYKAGKTTFNGQLLKAWADSRPFLGRYHCHPDAERPNVTIFNYEVSEGQFRRWMRKVAIRNTERVNVVHLRGIALPVALDAARKEVARILADLGTGLWIVDPASRAMAGFGDGSDNRDVNQFTSWLDEIKIEAGVRDLVLNIHMGHGAAKNAEDQRAIGAQAWSAWADALWFITRDQKTGARFFSAQGRDVDEPRMIVQYDDQDMSVRLAEYDPEFARLSDDELRYRRTRDAVLESIRQTPGITKKSLYASVRARQNDTRDILADLRQEGLIEIIARTGGGEFHYLAGTVPHLV